MLPKRPLAGGMNGTNGLRVQENQWWQLPQKLIDLSKYWIDHESPAGEQNKAAISVCTNSTWYIESIFLNPDDMPPIDPLQTFKNRNKSLRPFYPRNPRKNWKISIQDRESHIESLLFHNRDIRHDPKLWNDLLSKQLHRCSFLLRSRSSTESSRATIGRLTARDRWHWNAP